MFSHPTRQGSQPQTPTPAGQPRLGLQGYGAHHMPAPGRLVLDPQAFEADWVGLLSAPVTLLIGLYV